jgi:hypothetical protein
MSRSRTLIPCSAVDFLVAVHRDHDGRVKLWVVTSKVTSDPPRAISAVAQLWRDWSA